MVTKSKLKMALAADKGVDYKKLHLKKKEKIARKGKAKKRGGEEEESDDEGVELDEEESGSEEEVDGPMKVCL
jgi:rRNA-processing protein EBP2